MLFRDEVLKQRADKLSGDVSIAVPVKWQVIGVTLFVAILCAIAFLASAPYARIETVTGQIVPDAGTSMVLPTRPGILSELPVRDGQLVEKGAELAVVRAGEDGPGGGSAAAQLSAAITQQDSSLGMQLAAMSAATSAQRNQIEAQRSGIASELAQLESQRAFQQQLVLSAQEDLQRVRTVAERGFMSGREMRLREEQLLSRQQALSQITQSIAAKRAALSEAERSAGQLAAQSRAQEAGVMASRAQVAQQAASAKGNRAHVLTAPISGRVTALAAKAGQTVNPQSPLMTIVPEGASLTAELAIPSAAIGFVEKGQEVRLAIDAFPYQRFGTVKGIVTTVPTSAIPQQLPNGATAAVYPVTVTLEKEAMKAFGDDRPLLSGMSLTARIVTEKQSLLEWLFEPVFAVRKR